MIEPQIVEKRRMSDMKNVGIPRRLDELGRIVIPIDVRRLCL